MCLWHPRHEVPSGTIGLVEMVEVGTSTHCLRLSREPGSQNYLSAELRLPGLSARTDVYEFNGFESLADFFSGMVADWRGCGRASGSGSRWRETCASRPTTTEDTSSCA
ncbi:DUF6228 family protein [Acidipropionibacterium acidipropionici]|uniref:DUF6228 family protein n=2 Tax=Acidipropionibacterium acidipropionici TaxID=1748 RepID=UPI0039C88A0B